MKFLLHQKGFESSFQPNQYFYYLSHIETIDCVLRIVKRLETAIRPFEIVPLVCEVESPQPQLTYESVDARKIAIASKAARNLLFLKFAALRTQRP
ncbi:hypothetical protein [Bacillus sp. SA1-12]|uniref:hypothetical protein n=1 Tax=Bacillus sp. SA1-12 TaxID=1455638 RepID=UPI0018CEFADE|nr:hypothetical protein [Bacillus sp. SA1-12]